MTTLHLWTALTCILGCGIAVVSARAAWAHRITTRHAGGGTTLHIQAPPEVDPASATALWIHLAGLATPWWKRILLEQAHVAFEYAWDGANFDIRVWVPKTLPVNLVADAVRAAWPGASVTTTDPPAPALPAGPTRTTTGALRLGRDDASALAIGSETDPLRPMLAAMTRLRPGEHALVQILARPAGRWRIHHLSRSTTTPRRPGLGLVAAVIDLFLPSSKTSRRTERQAVPATALERARQRQLTERLGAAMFETVVRYAVATTRTGDTDLDKARIRGLADALATALTVHSGSDPIRRTRLPFATNAIGARSMRGGKLLTAAELAALAHVPLDETVPQLQRASAKLVAPVTAILHGGRNTKALGTAAVGDRPVALPIADARHHLHIVGSTGVGKSTLLLNLILADIRAGRGVVVVDPKGDLVTDVLARIDPPALAHRLVVIDPDDPDPPGINPLAGDDPDLVVDHFVGICRRIFERHWGPRADDVLRSALMTVVRYPTGTLEALPLLLSSKKARAPYVADLEEDPAGLGGFWTWYDNLAPGLQSQVVGPVVSRIRGMMTRSFVRKTIGAPTTTFDLTKILNGGILLARLPKGQLGDDTARLLGSVLVAKTWQATTARSAIPEHRRRDATMYLDEAQNFLTLPRALDEILAEARGYRLSLVLAHQNLAQLPRDMQFAISANARNKIFFNASPEDARLLARHTTPHLGEYDLAHLDAYTAACRLVVDGREQPAFTLATRPAPPRSRNPAPGRSVRVSGGQTSGESVPP